MLFRISSILRICSTCLLIFLLIVAAKLMIICVKTCRNHKKMNTKKEKMVNLWQNYKFDRPQAGRLRSQRLRDVLMMPY